jgi:hypothetical protein
MNATMGRKIGATALAGAVLAGGVAAAGPASARPSPPPSARPTGDLAGWGPNTARARTNEKVADRIEADLSWLTAKGVRLTQWGPDTATGKVKVYLTHYTASARNALLARYGSAVVVAGESRPRPVAVAGRRDDYPPFYGGDWISTPVGYCTGGPIVHNSDGQARMLTAGHCAAKGATVKTNGQKMGTVQRRKYAGSSSPGYDEEVVGGSYLGWVWGGGPSSAGSYCQAGGKFVDTGANVANDGAKSGEVRNIRVTDTDLHIIESDDNGGLHLIEGVSEATKDAVTPVIHPGDSGAPVIQHESGAESHVKIAGMAIAASPETRDQDAGAYMYYEQMKAIAKTLDVTAIKQCS